MRESSFRGLCFRGFFRAIFFRCTFLRRSFVTGIFFQGPFFHSPRFRGFFSRGLFSPELFSGIRFIRALQFASYIISKLYIFVYVFRLWIKPCPFFPCSCLSHLSRHRIHLIHLGHREFAYHEVSQLIASRCGHKGSAYGVLAIGYEICDAFASDTVKFNDL